MKSVTLLAAFVLLIEVNYAFNSKEISEAICYFSRLPYADIYKGDESIIQISKILFKKCNMTVRIITEAEEIGHTMIGFLNGNNDKVEAITNKRLLMKYRILYFRAWSFF